MTTARVAEFGDSIALVLSQEVIDQLGVRAGDDVQVVPTADGVNLRRVNPVVQAQLEVAKQIMEARREVLRKLAE